MVAVSCGVLMVGETLDGRQWLGIGIILLSLPDEAAGPLFPQAQTEPKAATGSVDNG